MKTALFISFLFAIANAWSINGHLYVANIAERLLIEKAPTSY